MMYRRYLILLSCFCVTDMFLCENLELRDAKAKWILEEHNEYRHKHGVSDLVLDDMISFHAQEWSDYSADIGHLGRRPYQKYGENFWHKVNVTLKQLMLTPNTNPVKFWYDEIKYYPGHYDPLPDRYTGSFTQIVWKGTRKLGVGITHRGQTIYVACFYQPPGNVRGANDDDTELIYRQNVFSQTGDTWNVSTKLYILLVITLLTAAIVIIKQLAYK